MVAQMARISRVAKILAFFFLVTLVFSLSEQGADAGPGPFTPIFTITLDEVAPDDPTVLPVDDDCPVGAPCKHHFRITVPDGQPSLFLGGGYDPAQGLRGVLLPDPVVGFAAGELVPNGAIIGRVFASRRIGSIGNCSAGSIFSYDLLAFDATTDPATTSGAASDLASFDHWPSQLNSVRDDTLNANPGSTIHSRWSIEGSAKNNVLIFRLADGSLLFTVVNNPTAPPSTVEECGPVDSNFVALGVSMNNPATGPDEGGFPLFTCASAGTQTYENTLKRNDTPPGDEITLVDTATCSLNTLVGVNVQVELLGGTQNLSGIAVTFSSVTLEGSTSVTGSTSGPAPPTGFEVAGLSGESLYYDINTTANFTGSLTLCVQYDDSGLSPAQESAVRLMQNESGVFIDRTTSVDTNTNIVCGEATHLSVWAVMFLTTPPTPTTTATPTPTATATPTITPTPTPPPPVGGIALDSELRSLPLETAPASSPPWGTAFGIAAAGVAGVAALGGAAWYTRRRRVN